MDKSIRENNKLFSKILYIVGLSVLAVLFVVQCIANGGFGFEFLNQIFVFGLIGLVLFFAKNEGTKKYAIFALAVVLVVIGFLAVQGFDAISAMFDWINVPYGIAYLISWLVAVYAFVVMVLFVLKRAFNINITNAFFSLSLQIILVALLAEFVFAFIGCAMTWGNESAFLPWYAFLDVVPTFCFAAYFVLNRGVLTGKTANTTEKKAEKEERKTEAPKETEEKPQAGETEAKPKKTTKKTTKKTK